MEARTGHCRPPPVLQAFGFGGVQGIDTPAKEEGEEEEKRLPECHGTLWMLAKFGRLHYGRKWTKTQTNSHLIIPFPTSEGVSEVSERSGGCERIEQSRLRSKRMYERCKRTSERTSEWPITSVCILGCYRP